MPGDYTSRLVAGVAFAQSGPVVGIGNDAEGPGAGSQQDSDYWAGGSSIGANPLPGPIVGDHGIFVEFVDSTGAVLSDTAFFVPDGEEEWDILRFTISSLAGQPDDGPIISGRFLVPEPNVDPGILAAAGLILLGRSRRRARAPNRCRAHHCSH